MVERLFIVGNAGVHEAARLEDPFPFVQRFQRIRKMFDRARRCDEINALVREHRQRMGICFNIDDVILSVIRIADIYLDDLFRLSDPAI